MKVKTLLGNVLRPAGLITLCLALGCVSAAEVGGVFGEQGRRLGEGLDSTGRALTLGDKDENQIGESVGVAVTAQYGLVQNEKLQKYVNLIGLTLADTTPRAGGNWVFGVLNTDEVNAFSGPNGYVMITMGAIKRMKDESELAGVLAHEIAHICKQHGLKAVKNAEGGKALSKLASAATEGEEAAAFTSLADAGIEGITKNGYDKPSEFEADKEAIPYLIDAGYDPHGLVNYLKRIQTEVAGGGIMGTHPGISERITRLESKLIESGNPTGATLASRFATWTGGK